MTENFIVMDNFLNKGYLKKCKDEIRSLEDSFKLFELPIYVAKRVDLDTLYMGRKSDSPILRVIEDSLFSDVIKILVAAKYDPYFRLFGKTNFHNTFITAHLPGEICSWHTDDVLPNGLFNGELLNYVVYIDMDSKFTGGNIEISYEQVDNIKEKPVGCYPDKEPRLDDVIEFKDNRFVIFPTYLWHQVPPIKCDNYESIFDGRISINGHIGIR